MLTTNNALLKLLLNNEAKGDAPVFLNFNGTAQIPLDVQRIHKGEHGEVIIDLDHTAADVHAHRQTTVRFQQGMCC